MAEPDVPAVDLLFGLLAVQTGLISQGGLSAGCEAFRRDRSPERSLAKSLVDIGLLTRWQRGLLENLRVEHLARYDGEPDAALAAFVACRTAPPLAESESNSALMTTLGFSVGESRPRPGLDLDATIADVPNMAAADPLEGTVAGQPPDDELSDLPTVAGPGTFMPRTPDRRAINVLTPARAGADRFRIENYHASGGLGVVYRAHDAELNRDVALKRIKDSHADDPVSRQRFLLEAEVTGGLEHPGVVPVYGLGTSPDGRLYYAMRFIRGIRLTDAIATYHADAEFATHHGARSLELRKLLRRFLDVCNTIEYAHGRGVLHRDIKPDNVMVGRYGETLVVDWGIAKVTGRTDPARSGGERPLTPTSSGGETETLAGTAIGSPAFMSPEQAAGTVEALGPASDVYSLGATLYVILTGRPPFLGRDLKTVLREVREGNFPPPREVGRSVDRALEAICLKAMALQPEDRYPSAQALAEDVERWTADEPVSAFPEPFRERARRWARRNRTAVTAAAAAVVVAIAGLALILAVEARANRDLRAANQEIQARFELSSRAIRTFYTGVSEDLLLRQSEFQGLRRNLLGSAREFYIELEKLLEGRPDRASRQALARAFFDLGDLTWEIGERPDALAAHRRALQLREALAAGPEATPEARDDVGRSKLAIGYIEYQLGKFADAERDLASGRGLLEQRVTDPEVVFALAKGYQTLGRLREDTGQLEPAMSAHQRARELLTELANAAPTVSRYRAKLAETLQKLGTLYNRADRIDEALAAADEARKLLDELVDADPDEKQYQVDLALSDKLRGTLLEKNRRTDAALQAHLRAVELLEKLVRDAPTNTEFQSHLARSTLHIGALRSRTGDTPGALEAYARARQLWQKLADAHPSVPKFQADLQALLGEYGSLLARIGQTEDALAKFEEARAILEALVKAQPLVADYQSNLALIHVRIADIFERTGRATDALEAYGRARAIQEAVAAAQPNVPELLLDLSWTDNAIGDLLGAMAVPFEGLAALERARVARARLAADHPEVPDYRAELARTQMKTALLIAEFGRPAAALRRAREARAAFAAVAAADPKNTDFQAELAQMLDNQAEILAAAGRATEALDLHMQSREQLSALADASPDNIELRSGRALCGNEAAELLISASRPTEALAALDRARDDWDALVKKSPAIAEYHLGLLRNHRLRADALARARQIDAAARSYTTAGSEAEALVRRFPELPAFAVEGAHCDEGRGAFARAFASLDRLQRPRPADRYFLARLQARKSVDGSALAALRRAVAAGYRDAATIASEPAFQSLRDARL